MNTTSASTIDQLKAAADPANMDDATLKALMLENIREVRSGGPGKFVLSLASTLAYRLLCDLIQNEDTLKEQCREAGAPLPDNGIIDTIAMIALSVLPVIYNKMDPDPESRASRMMVAVLGAKEIEPTVQGFLDSLGRNNSAPNDGNAA